jgi:HEAT repeat protein
MRLALAILTALALLPPVLPAQSLLQQVRRTGDGTARLAFAARPGVCGHAGGIMVSDDDDEWVADCAPGPVMVSLDLRGGRVIEATTRVGGRWRAGGGRVTDLGLVPAREASRALLELARGAGEEAAGDILLAATLADSVEVWPDLLRMARDSGLPVETRRQAVFWLGQAAGDAATRGLDSIVVDDRGDLEVREHAVFALSQRPADEGVPALIRVARTNPHAELRRKALFWLGQSDDPRALALFEELLQ